MGSECEREIAITYDAQTQTRTYSQADIVLSKLDCETM